jgi:magnesium-transporting ATPase (P-type)
VSSSSTTRHDKFRSDLSLVWHSHWHFPQFSKAPSQVSGDDVADATQKKKPGFFSKLFGGGKGGDELYEVPEEWLATDIKTGLTSAEVENRRRKTGFNELTTEKENMFLKVWIYPPQQLKNLRLTSQTTVPRLFQRPYSLW